MNIGLEVRSGVYPKDKDFFKVLSCLHRGYRVKRKEEIRAQERALRSYGRLDGRGRAGR